MNKGLSLNQLWAQSVLRALRNSPAALREALLAKHGPKHRDRAGSAKKKVTHAERKAKRTRVKVARRVNRSA